MLMLVSHKLLIFFLDFSYEIFIFRRYVWFGSFSFDHFPCMRHSRFLIGFFSFFFLGVAGFDALPLAWALGLVAGAGGVFLVFSWRKYRRGGEVLLNWKMFSVSAWSGLLIGGLVFVLNVPNFSTGDIAFYRDLEANLLVEGVVDAEVDLRSDRQYLVLATRRLGFKGRWSYVEGKLLIKAERYPEFVYGDLLRVGCQLRSPPEFEKFSYADYLAKDDIFVVCYKPKISWLAGGHGSFFWSVVYGLKTTFSGQINAIFTEPEASLAAGLLFGLRRNIPAGILDDFNRAGLTHLLAISGYNITLMITIFGLAFKAAARRVRFFGILGGIFLFLLFTGFSASVIRAAWMGFFVILASAVGRKANGLLILLWSGFVMVFLNPRMLLSDLSFELSFTATLGLILIMPVFEKFLEDKKKFPRWKEWFRRLPDFVREGLLVTMAAQVFTTPIILYYFGRFSVIAPVANIIFLPLVPFIMFFSFFALMFSFVFFPLAQLMVAISWVLIQFLVLGVHVVAHVPFASVEW